MKQQHFGEYPSNWKEVAKQVKDDAGWQCVRCGYPHDPKAGYCLTVHHLDCDKSNCKWWNTVALCQRCHLQIQGRVIMQRAWLLPHSEWFKPYVAGYYAYINNLPDYYEYVMANMDSLIAIGQCLEEVA